MKPAIYISGASAELDQIEVFRDRLHAAGINVRDAWMLGVRKAISAGIRDRDLSFAQAQAIALGDFGDIIASDLFWLIIPTAPTKGAWIELGVAMILKRDIVISGDLRCTPFLCHPHIAQRFETHEEAFQYIKVVGQRSE